MDAVKKAALPHAEAPPTPARTVTRYTLEELQSLFKNYRQQYTRHITAGGVS